MAQDTPSATDASANGMFSRVGKYSWLITIFALLGGPLGSYMVFRQEMLVELAKIELQIAQERDKSSTIQEKVDKGMVPKEVHDTRIEMQKEVDILRAEMERLRATYEDERIKELRDEVQELRRRK